MGTPNITSRAGHPDFLDLPWSLPLDQWEDEHIVELPTGIHRPVVRFVVYDDRIYAIKELPIALARHEHDTLRRLSSMIQPIAAAIGVVERTWADPSEEISGAVITRYVDFSFTYRELVEGGGFGRNRNRLLDAFAGLLVELHLVGCFWGDCSLSNVLYRWDGGAIQAIMIDAETSELHDGLSDGQRLHDLDVMRTNVAWGMADIAASEGIELAEADLTLGDDIINRYEGLWDELQSDVTFAPGEQYRVHEKVQRLNDLGFEVADLQFRPTPDGEQLVAKIRLAVGGRTYHSGQLRTLTNVEATEHSSRRILADLHHYVAANSDRSATGKSVAAIRWRVNWFEPLIERLFADFPGQSAVNRYADFLHHRYLMATDEGRDLDNDEAYERWVAQGGPGIDSGTLPPESKPLRG
ncbi:MAG: DUF4032 domain-containing protein [Acidimicrobiia bacterium]|nr:DUF4032 domain-containing protein [Acidimicrobiia bacterium]